MFSSLEVRIWTDAYSIFPDTHMAIESHVNQPCSRIATAYLVHKTEHVSLPSRSGYLLWRSHHIMDLWCPSWCWFFFFLAWTYQAADKSSHIWKPRRVCSNSPSFLNPFFTSMLSIYICHEEIKRSYQSLLDMPFLYFPDHGPFPTSLLPTLSHTFLFIQEGIIAVQEFQNRWQGLSSHFRASVRF